MGAIGSATRNVDDDGDSGIIIQRLAVALLIGRLPVLIRAVGLQQLPKLLLQFV